MFLLNYLVLRNLMTISSSLGGEAFHELSSFFYSTLKFFSDLINSFA